MRLLHQLKFASGGIYQMQVKKKKKFLLTWNEKLDLGGSYSHQEALSNYFFF